MAALRETLWNEPITVHRGDVWQLGRHRLMCGDATRADEVTRLLDGNTCDLIFADPPYGIGIDAWDTAIPDVPAFIDLITSHLKQGGFFTFTHQMPYMVDWLYALKHSRLKYKDHIAWVKRSVSAPLAPLQRTHESLFIYSCGTSKYFSTEGLYTDVKIPGVMYDITSIDRIERYIKDLHFKVKTGRSGSTVGNNTRHQSYGYGSDYQPSDVSPETANFTNVWSFLPEHQGKRNGRKDNHPTAKPILLMNRLLELCTPENALVYDAFLGSGTTLLAGQNTNRTVYGMELSPEYCASIIQRWQEATGQKAERVEVAA